MISKVAHLPSSLHAKREALPDRTSATGLDGDFLHLISTVAHLMRARTDQRANVVHGMSRAQWAILVWLERQPGLSQRQLAELVHVEPITVARLIDRFEADALVERRADPADRRLWRLHLTPAAAPVLAEIAAYRSDLHRQMAAGLSQAALATLVDALAGMKDNLSRKAPAIAETEGVQP